MGEKDLEGVLIGARSAIQEDPGAGPRCHRGRWYGGAGTRNARRRPSAVTVTAGSEHGSLDAEAFYAGRPCPRRTPSRIPAEHERVPLRESLSARTDPQARGDRSALGRDRGCGGGLCGGMAWSTRSGSPRAGRSARHEAPANGSPLFRSLVRSQVQSLRWFLTHGSSGGPA
jgi:hypothetical protein